MNRLRHDSGPVGLVVWSCAQLIARNVQDRNEVLAVRLEAQRRPGDGDLAGADAEKSPELDHRRLHAAAAVGKKIYDSAYVLLVAAAHLDAEDAFAVAELEAGVARMSLADAIFVRARLRLRGTCLRRGGMSQKRARQNRR